MMRFALFPWMLSLTVGVSACGAADRHAESAAETGVDGESAGSLFAKGSAAAERGDSVRAEQYLVLAIAKGYDRRAALPVLLSACLSSLHLRTALDHAQGYLLDHPEDDGLRYLVATIHVGLGQHAEARTELERLLQHSEGDPEARFLLGVLDLEVDPDLARELFVRYLDEAPHGPRAAEAAGRLSELSRLAARSGRRADVAPPRRRR